MKLLKDLSKSIVDGEDDLAVRICQELLQSGCEPNDIMEKGLRKGMDMLDTLFKNGDKFIPEVLMSTRAMNASFEVLKPYVCTNDLPLNGTIIIGTVKGDIHNIGIKLVSLMLQSACFKVVNLGTNVSKEEFVAAIREHNASIVTLSAMITTAMTNMTDTVKTLQNTTFDNPLYIIVGGAPVTQRYAKKINVEFAENALVTRNKALSFVKNKKK